MGAQLKSCQLSFSKSLFAGVLKTGVNSRKKCLLLEGGEREGQGMFCRADCACTTSLVAARCWSGIELGYSSSSLQGSQSSFSVTGSGEAAGRSTGLSQCVRH